MAYYPYRGFYHNPHYILFILYKKYENLNIYSDNLSTPSNFWKFQDCPRPTTNLIAILILDNTKNFPHYTSSVNKDNEIREKNHHLVFNQTPPESVLSIPISVCAVIEISF